MMVRAVNQRDPRVGVTELFAKLEAAKACAQHPDARMFIFRHPLMFDGSGENAISEFNRSDIFTIEF